MSFGESLPDIFIRVWVSAAPENLAHLAGYVGASMFATLATVTALSIQFYVFVPLPSTGMHQELAHVLLHATLAFFSCADTGPTLNRFTEDMSSIVDSLLMLVLRFFYFMFHAILHIVIIGSGTTGILAPLPAIGVVAGLLLYYFLQTSRQVRSIQLAAKTPLYKHFDETVSNFLVGLTILDVSQKT
ncbi:hypothetical protein NHJ13734_001218, partial [Beauveria thailandica]